MSNNLNSDPEVIRHTLESPIDRNSIQKQILPKFFSYYEEYVGYGVWAVLERATRSFIGWFSFRPFKYASYFDPNLANPDDIELGYRLLKIAWGKGYATEGAKALMDRGFCELRMQRVIAAASTANVASIRVMEKIGLQFQMKFFYEQSGQEVVIYALDRD
ncbi:MAG: GNAT family N-acetyltransferase [Xenococcaceae cyanobacterium]